MTQPGPRLRTHSLVLRPFEATDFEDFFRLAGDAEVTRYLLWGPRERDSALDAFEKRLASTRPGYDGPHRQFVIAHEGRFVGEMGLLNLDPPNRDGEIGYMLDPAFYGRGFAAEAGRALLRHGFADMGLHRIHGRCDERNTASARVMEKIGMRREAHHLSTHFYKGDWAGGFVYAILEDEWRAQNS